MSDEAIYLFRVHLDHRKVISAESKEEALEKLVYEILNGDFVEIIDDMTISLGGRYEGSLREIEEEVVE